MGLTVHAKIMLQEIMPHYRHVCGFKDREFESSRDGRLNNMHNKSYDLVTIVF